MRASLTRFAFGANVLGYATGFWGAHVLSADEHPGAPALFLALGVAVVELAAITMAAVAAVRARREKRKLASAVAALVLALVGLGGGVLLGFVAAVALSLEHVPIH